MRFVGLLLVCLVGCDAAPDPDGTGSDDLAGPDAGSRSVCATVAHVGDSLTAGVADKLRLAYAEVGVTATIDAVGGRAVLQKTRADPRTGEQAAKLLRAGLPDCWVVALGTNDTANIAAGSVHTRAKSIDRMMTAIDPAAAKPVLWVDAFTTRTSGFWSNANMQLWNSELAAARTRWPNLEVFAWSKIAATREAPYSDGIHHTGAGYVVRNAAIAAALKGAFSHGSGVQSP